MTGNQPGRIFLIDTASAWFAVLVFFLVNILLLVLTQTLLPNLDALYFIGFTQKAYWASIIIAPLFVFVLRRFGKTSIWDMSFWLVILTAAIMASRYRICPLRVVDDPLYSDIFDPRLGFGSWHAGLDLPGEYSSPSTGLTACDEHVSRLIPAVRWGRIRAAYQGG